MKTTRYVHKPLFVDAALVTAENLEEAAKWCQGDIRKTTPKDQSIPGLVYIKVFVTRPLKTRQTQAFIGDWILRTEMGFKVYTNKAFQETFVRVDVFTEHDTPAETLLKEIFTEVGNA